MNIQDFKNIKEKLEKNYISSLLDFAYENAEEIKSPPDGYMDCYNIIMSYSDFGDEKGFIIYSYYIKLIKDYIKFCYKLISSQNDENTFIDDFINITDKINHIIFYLKKYFII